jgi:hypothetical protein
VNLGGVPVGRLQATPPVMGGALVLLATKRPTELKQMAACGAVMVTPELVEVSTPEPINSGDSVPSNMAGTLLTDQ